MHVDEARRILGVPPGAELEVVRAAYRRRLLRTHPDVSQAPDATTSTIRLTEAFLVLSDPPTDTDDARRSGTTGTRTAPAPGPPPRPERSPIGAELVDDDTIAVPAPADEVLMMLVDTAHALGDISYLDPSNGLVEVIVEFVEAPTSSVLLSMQGRATGVTDVFCTVEPLSGGDAPPADAVTRLILHTLRERSQDPGNAPH